MTCHGDDGWDKIDSQTDDKPEDAYSAAKKPAERTLHRFLLILNL